VKVKISKLIQKFLQEKGSTILFVERSNPISLSGCGGTLDVEIIIRVNKKVKQNFPMNILVESLKLNTPSCFGSNTVLNIGGFTLFHHVAKFVLIIVSFM
jgi:hypothetical protein